MSRRGKSEGSIYRRRDGRWTASVDLGFVDGRRVRKNYYGPTRNSVASKLTGALNRQQTGGLVKTNDVLSVESYLDRWLSSLSVRPKTKRQYEQITRLYLKPAIGPVRLARLDPDQVRAMVAGLERRGLSERTATLSRDILRAALSQAMSDGLIGRNVASLVRRPKARRREGTTLDAEQCRALLAALAGNRLEAVVTCGVALGLRLGEVLGLQWSNVDVKKGTVTVRQALQTAGKRRELVDVKSRESHRTIHLPAIVARAFERHKAKQAAQRLAAGEQWMRSNFVFTTRVGRPLDGTLVTRDLKQIAARTWLGGRAKCEHDRVRERECLDCGAAGLPAVNFHGLRHSCASLLLASGVPVREVADLLGHSDVRLTLSTYAHVLEAGRRNVSTAVDRILDSQSDSQTAGRG